MVGKLLERILRDRIYSHLEISGRISERQHGFVKGRSCLTKLIEVFEEVTKMIDEGRAVDVVYMDFSKAFDKWCSSGISAGTFAVCNIYK